MQNRDLVGMETFLFLHDKLLKNPTDTKIPRGQHRVRVRSDAHTVLTPFLILFSVAVGCDPPRRTPS